MGRCRESLCSEQVPGWKRRPCLLVLLGSRDLCKREDAGWNPRWPIRQLCDLGLGA